MVFNGSVCSCIQSDSLGMYRQIFRQIYKISFDKNDLTLQPSPYIFPRDPRSMALPHALPLNYTFPNPILFLTFPILAFTLPFTYLKHNINYTNPSLSLTDIYLEAYILSGRGGNSC